MLAPTQEVIKAVNVQQVTEAVIELSKASKSLKAAHERIQKVG